MLPINVFLLAVVTSKETRAAIIALHQNGLTCKGIATKNIAPERTIYRIIKNFKERGLTAVKKPSGMSQSVQQAPGLSPPEELAGIVSPAVQSLLRNGNRLM